MKKINLAVVSFMLFAVLFVPSFVSAQAISPAASGASPSSTTTNNTQTSPTTNNQSGPQPSKPATLQTNSQTTQNLKHNSKPTAMIVGAVFILGLLVVATTFTLRRKLTKP